MSYCPSYGDEKLEKIVEDTEWEDSERSVKVNQAGLERSPVHNRSVLIPNIRHVLEKYEEIKQNVSKNASRYSFGNLSNEGDSMQSPLAKSKRKASKEPLDEIRSIISSRILPDDPLSIIEETYDRKFVTIKSLGSENNISVNVGSPKHLLNTEYDVDKFKRSRQDQALSVDSNKNNWSRRASLGFVAEEKKNANKIPDDNKKTVRSACKGQEYQRYNSSPRRVSIPTREKLGRGLI
jgi:hypothetical protein